MSVTKGNGRYINVEKKVKRSTAGVYMTSQSRRETIKAKNSAQGLLITSVSVNRTDLLLSTPPSCLFFL